MGQDIPHYRISRDTRRGFAFFQSPGFRQMKRISNHIDPPDELLCRIAETLEGHGDVLSAYLFGSTATGHARSGSDIDIAVRLAPRLDSQSRFQLRMALIDHIEKIVDRPVDMVVINFMPFEFSQRSVRPPGGRRRGLFLTTCRSRCHVPDQSGRVFA